MISFEGIPAVYFNSLFGTSNDEAKFIISGNNRDVNRYRWNNTNLLNKLKNSKSKQYIFYKNITHLLEIRRKQSAFHPNAYRQTINLGPKIFCFKRVSLDKRQTIICITNLSSKVQKAKLKINLLNFKNLIFPNHQLVNKNVIEIQPFQTLWLSN